MTAQSVHLEISPDPRQIAAVRRHVAAFASRAGMDAPALIDVQVAVSDAVTTAILHAAAERERVHVEAESSGRELVVRVREGGTGTARPPIDGVLGPRLSMIAALAQVFGMRRCESGATEISMRFAIARRQTRTPPVMPGGSSEAAA
jgi:anti-sigma regulatory factor (Ser/Thr protein kinase)